MKNTAAKKLNVQACGFQIPAQLADFPLAPRSDTRLTLEEEQSFGFQVLIHTLSCISALVCDLEIATNMLTDIREAFTANGKADKAMSLVLYGGFWLRPGSVSDKDYAAIVQKHINAAQTAVDVVAGLAGGKHDLFYMQALADLRKAFSQFVPYDPIVSKAMIAFEAKCRAINAECREFVIAMSTRLSVPRPRIQALCFPHWASKDLVAACICANRQAHMAMAPAEKKTFKQEFFERQARIISLASESQAPALEMVTSWAQFSQSFHKINRLQGTFASMNVGLVEKEVNTYSFAKDVDQIRSAAYQGLTRAMTLYAPEKGFKFSGYAHAWIKQMILRELVAQDTVRLPEGAHTTITRIKAVYADMPNASDEYVCEKVCIGLDELSALRPYVSGANGMSLEAALNDEKDLNLHSVLEDDNNNFSQEVEDANLATRFLDLLKGVLTEREYFVLKHRRELESAEFMTMGEIAKVLGVSAQNVNRIEKEAIAKLASISDLEAMWLDVLGA